MNPLKNKRTSTWSLLLLVLSICLECGMGQTVNETALPTTSDSHNHDNDQCPVYREFHPELANDPQFGAPNGCSCVEGMQGHSCGYCTSDIPCKANNPSHVCRTGLVFAEKDTYRDYECRLFSTLETLLHNGRASIYVDIEKGTASMAIYNNGINNRHHIDCNITDCDFQVGGTGGKCGNVDCVCDEVLCDSFTRQIVHGALSGQPAEITFEETEDGPEAHMKIDMPTSPIQLEAMCNASACTLDPTADLDEDVVAQMNKRDTEWSQSATFSIVVLAIIMGVFMLLIVCTCIPLLGDNGSSKNPKDLGNEQELQETNETRQNYDHEESDMSDRSNNSHVLEFRHLSRAVQLRPDAARAYGKKDKLVLQNISGSVESGTLMGIMGPSGSGKSSLLNILAAVENSDSRVSGQILLNGKPNRSAYRKAVAYVHQDDALYGTLTVHECIEYSAFLRLPKTMSPKQKQALVWKTLQELHLVDIAHNRIGAGGKTAGVSGGERKRVSVGMELVSQPTVIALDEPTSGLDSHAANNIINVLSELASRNRIVILSVHQPSMKSFLTMDKILLLGGGHLLYNGAPSEVETFLAERNFFCPELETVADFMLDIASNKQNHGLLKGPDMDSGAFEKLSDSRDTDDAEQAVDKNRSFEDLSAEPTSFVMEISTLLARTSKDIFRNKELFFMQLVISIGLACFAGAIFNNVTNDLAGFQNRMGAFYFSLSFFAFASFSSMDIFVKERHIFVREAGAKYFQPFSYFLAKTVLDIFVLRVIPVSIFCLTFYWMMGLKDETEAFIIFWATLVLFNICAGVMSICISIATPTVGQANLIAVVWFLIMLLFGGFLVNVNSMAPWYAWLKYLSIFYYSFEILMTNELEGLLLSFDAPDYPALPIYGEVFLQTIGMNIEDQTRNMMCLCILAAGFTLASYLLLLFRVPPSASEYFKRMQKENKRLAREYRNIQDNFDDYDDEESWMTAQDV